MLYRKGIFIFASILGSFFSLSAADTLRVTIFQADSIFLVTNFRLLAAALEMEAAEAQIIQARLYPNPVISADFNAYDPQNQRVFHVGSTGQMSFSYEQLILLGGKRKNLVEMARSDKRMAEWEFQDLIRQLRFALHGSLYDMEQQLFLIEKYSRQMEMLDTLIETYREQVDRNNIPMRDLVRLKGIYLGLSNKRSEIYTAYFNSLAVAQMLLQTESVILPVIPAEFINASVRTLDADSLQILALKNRPDYQMVSESEMYAEAFVKYQNNLAVPDLSFIASYDQRGGAFGNQVNLGFSIALPVFNRNQGGKRAARAQLQQVQLLEEAYKIQVLSEVHNYYAQYEQTVGEFLKVNEMYTDDFEMTRDAMSRNFQVGNISLLEFTDFLEGYNDAMEEVARTRMQLVKSAEYINWSTGTLIFK